MRDVGVFLRDLRTERGRDFDLAPGDGIRKEEEEEMREEEQEEQERRGTGGVEAGREE